MIVDGAGTSEVVAVETAPLESVHYWTPAQIIPLLSCPLGFHKGRRIPIGEILKNKQKISDKNESP